MKTYVSCPFFVLFILCTAWYKMVWQNSLSIFQQWPNFLYVSQGTCKTVCYASAFRRWRHYVFGLSVRPSVLPSVRSPKYPLSTCTWVRWSIRPTMTVLRHVRPSIGPSVPPFFCPSIRPSGEVSGPPLSFDWWSMLPAWTATIDYGGI